jgi:hypothetical protein
MARQNTKARNAKASLKGPGTDRRTASDIAAGIDRRSFLFPTDMIVG